VSYAQKIQSTRARVFCLIGDGELNEGTIWETLLVASQHKLNNFIVIVDQNHSSDRAINPTSLTSKFDSFGFITKEINGHNLDEVQEIYIENSIGEFVLESNLTIHILHDHSLQFEKDYNYLVRL
jgi:transketolase